MKEKKSKSILFIYAVEEGLGLVPKAEKIEQGLREAGCNIIVKKFVLRDSRVSKISNFLIASLVLIPTALQRRYHVIFVRHSYFFLFFYIFCIAVRLKIQFDINTKEKEEFVGRGQRFRAKLAAIALSLAVKSAARIHAVTHEILDHYKEVYPKAPIIYNPNFVVDEEYDGELHRTGDIINLVFLGNTSQPWQGIPLFVEKVVRGNSWFIENCRLHYVGGTDLHTEGLIADRSIRHVFVRHGYIRGTRKRDLIRTMDIGISGFNFQALSMKQATPIKVAEYLYAGLPVIIGYEDPRLSKNVARHICLRIDLAKQSDVQSKVNGFIRSVSANPRLRQIAHQYAEDHLTVREYVCRILQ